MGREREDVGERVRDGTQFTCVDLAWKQTAKHIIWTVSEYAVPQS